MSLSRIDKYKKLKAIRLGGKTGSFVDDGWDKFKEEEARRLKVNVQIQSNCNEQCKKCGDRNVHVREVQTRSADEAATCFYHCISCDRRWKTN